ncbi:hypothetical protein C8R43DRAFT_1134818 [Mycena crocata]|nr:hypothetical protein C8R43DRAFT_1134818 [Mycena crocata]
MTVTHKRDREVEEGEVPEAQRRKVDTLLHDPTFYRDDGDCIVQIHQYHLLRGESSAFREILDAGDVGQSDAKPILLTETTTAQFRAFLDLVYGE